MWGAAWLLAAAPALACAQEGGLGEAEPDSARLSASVELTVARAHFEEFLPSVFVAVAPEARLDLGSTHVLVRGSVARFAETGNLNLQGAVGVGTFTPRMAGVRAEIATFAALGSHEGLGRSGTAQALVRAHVARDGLGGWAGVAGGWSSLGGGIGVATWRGDLGVWGRFVGTRAALVVQPTRVGELRYTSVDASLRWALGRAELGVEGGFRAGDRTVDESRGAKLWASADGVLWVNDRLAVVAGSGRFLSDPVTNSIGGRYTSVGVRLSTGRARGVRPAELPRVILPRRPHLEGGTADERPERVERLEVVETAGGGITIRLTLPGARSAEIMGDFTDWEPVALRPVGDDVWAVTVLMEPGVHRLNLRTDGGDWRVPPDLTAVDDGFGGKVGLVVVRR
ncbi:MAG TPA: glycogen-binding domain-containing protein [Gemmatimonadales bacterium]